MSLGVTPQQNSLPFGLEVRHGERMRDIEQILRSFTHPPNCAQRVAGYLERCNQQKLHQIEKRDAELVFIGTNGMPSNPSLCSAAARPCNQVGLFKAIER